MTMLAPLTVRCEPLGEALRPAQDRLETPALVCSDVDRQLVDLWLHGRPPRTQETYRRDVERFLVWSGKPLVAVTLGELQTFTATLEHLAPATQARMLSA